jgi:hypothetical protein
LGNKKYKSIISMSANVYGGRRNNNLNANNARQMTPAAARATLRNTRLSTIVRKGQRGLVIFYILLITSLLPKAEGYIPSQTLNTIRERRNAAAPLLTNAQKRAAGSVAKQGAVIAGALAGGQAGAAGVLLAQIRGDPMIQAALLLSGIAMFVYKYIGMQMAANARRHEANERQRNRRHQLELLNKQQEFFMQMMSRQQEMLPNVVMAIMQGRDPTLAQIAGPLAANQRNS